MIYINTHTDTDTDTNTNNSYKKKNNKETRQALRLLLIARVVRPQPRV